MCAWVSFHPTLAIEISDKDIGAIFGSFDALAILPAVLIPNFCELDNLDHFCQKS